MGSNSTQAYATALLFLALILIAAGLGQNIGIILVLLGVGALVGSIALFLKCKSWEHIEQ